MGCTYSAASTTVTVATTVSTPGSYLFKIKGYTAAKSLSRGVPVRSGRFWAAGQSWHVWFYPNVASGSRAFLKLGLRARGTHWPDHATVRFTLVPRHGGEPVSFTRTFEPMWEAGVKSMAMKELHKYIADDGSLHVQCEVSVSRTSVVRELMPSMGCCTHGASTIPVATPGSYVFKIKGYTASKNLGRGVPLRSGRFSAGGQSWHIWVYPNVAGGRVYLKLGLRARGNHWPERATVRFTLVPRDGGEPVSFSRTFKPMWEAGVKSMSREELDRYVADDDTLHVRCEVSVMRRDKHNRRRRSNEEVHAEAASCAC